MSVDTVKTLINNAPRVLAPTAAESKQRPRAVMLQDAPDGIIATDINQDNVALVFTKRYGKTLRYSHDRGRWYHWTGRCWQEEFTRLAFDFARALTRDLNEESRREFAKASFCEGVEKFAQADRALAMRGDEWDRDPWLINTPGGTVDLRTGTMRPHDPDDLITRLTTAAPEAKPPERWLTFLHEASGGDEQMVAFLRRVLGYALTGDTREEALFFVWGDGGTGKSTFANVGAEILGDYARTAAMDTFLASRHERHSTDLAMLRGARLVTASETTEGPAWDEAKVKSLTGRDPITARFMRQDNFTYLPEFKLLLIDVHGVGELLRVVVACTLAMLVFAALTMNWMRVRNRWWEGMLLALAVLLLFRPDFFMDRVEAEFRDEPAKAVYDVAKATAAGERIALRIQGTTLEGKDVAKTVALNLGPLADDGRRRLAQAGVQVMTLGDRVQIGAVKFGSQAHKAGLEQGWDIVAVKVPTDRPSPHWFYLPALLLVGVVWVSQGRRLPLATARA